MTREKKNQKDIINKLENDLFYQNSLVKIWLRWFKKKCLNDQKRGFSEDSVVNHLNFNSLEFNEMLTIRWAWCQDVNFWSVVISDSRLKLH